MGCVFFLLKNIRATEYHREKKMGRNFTRRRAWILSIKYNRATKNIQSRSTSRTRLLCTSKSKKSERVEDTEVVVHEIPVRKRIAVVHQDERLIKWDLDENHGI
jgi:hypothetical protein